MGPGSSRGARSECRRAGGARIGGRGSGRRGRRRAGRARPRRDHPSRRRSSTRRRGPPTTVRGARGTDRVRDPRGRGDAPRHGPPPGPGSGASAAARRRRFAGPPHAARSSRGCRWSTPDAVARHAATSPQGGVGHGTTDRNTGSHPLRCGPFVGTGSSAVSVSGRTDVNLGAAVRAAPQVASGAVDRRTTRLMSWTSRNGPVGRPSIPTSKRCTARTPDLNRGWWMVVRPRWSASSRSS